MDPNENPKVSNSDSEGLKELRGVDGDRRLEVRGVWEDTQAAAAALWSLSCTAAI